VRVITIGWRLNFESRQKYENFLSFRLWGPPPASYPKDTQAISPDKRGQDVKLITHLHLLERLRMCGGLSVLPHTSSRCVALST
jgi:hypothetical protein